MQVLPLHEPHREEHPAQALAAGAVLGQRALEVVGADQPVAQQRVAEALADVRAVHVRCGGGAGARVAARLGLRGRDLGGGAVVRGRRGAGPGVSQWRDSQSRSRAPRIGSTIHVRGDTPIEIGVPVGELRRRIAAKGSCAGASGR